MKDIADNEASVEINGMNVEGVETPFSRVPCVCIEVPVLVYASEGQGEPFYVECKTIHVDPQGALLAIARTLVVGQSILLINSDSRKEMICNVKSVRPDESGLNHVDVEFSKKSRKFWRIKFPANGGDPADREALRSPTPACDPVERQASESAAPASDPVEYEALESSVPASAPVDCEILESLMPASDSVEQDALENSVPAIDPAKQEALESSVTAIDPSERESAQSSVLAADPYVQSLARQFADDTADGAANDVPETDTGTNLETSGIRTSDEETADLTTKPETETPADRELGSAPEPETTQPAQEAPEDAGNGASREATGISEPVIQPSARRGPRVHLEMPVRVNLPGEPFHEECRTVEIGAFGALLAVPRVFDVGQSLVLTNPKSLKQITCQVRNIRQISSSVNHLGVEFAIQSNKFWGMTFPSDECDPSERKRVQRPLSSRDPSFRPLPGQWADLRSAGPPEDNVGANSKPTKNRKAHAETTTPLTKPQMEPPSVPRRDDVSKPNSTHVEGTSKSGDNSASRETIGVDPSFAGTPIRRGPRVHLEVPVLVGLPGLPEHDECKTVEVGAFGALLVIPKEVEVGQLLILTNPNSLKQISCRVRNVKQISPGVNRVGVEFAIESNIFWGMTFPSSDWDPSERKRLERPVSAGDASFRPLPGQPASHSTGVGKNQTGVVRRKVAMKPAAKWAMVGLAALALFAIVWFVIQRPSNTGAPASGSVAPPGVASEDIGLIPSLANYRLVTPEDFDSQAVSWLLGLGQQASGKILGFYSAFKQSSAYILVGKQNARRVVILADGKLRYDGEFPVIAVAARVPKQLIPEITWADPSPPLTDGDGLLIVRSFDAPSSGVILFLQGDQVITANPTDYRQIPLGPSPQDSR